MDTYFGKQNKTRKRENIICKGLQLVSYQRFDQCKLFRCRVLNTTTGSQSSWSSASLFCHVTLQLGAFPLCMCHVKRFGLRTHCWRWGCLWHLTAQRPYSQSLPLWTASTEEIHLWHHRKHCVTAVSKLGRPQFSLVLSVLQLNYYHKQHFTF